MSERYSNLSKYELQRPQRVGQMTLQAGFEAEFVIVEFGGEPNEVLKPTEDVRDYIFWGDIPFGD